MGDVHNGADTLLHRPQRPDSSEVQAQTRQLSQSIEKYAARIQELKDLAGKRRNERQPPSAEEKALEKSLKDAHAHFQTALRQKQSIREALTKAKEARTTLKAKVRHIKENSANVSNLEDIEHQIKRLEEKVNTTDLDEKEQQECITEIRQLARSREMMRNLKKQLETMQTDENLCDDLAERLKDVDAELDKHKAKEKELSKQLELIRKQREDQEMDIGAWNAEKEECWQILCALRAKKKEINVAFTAKMDAYRKEEKQFQAKKHEAERKKREEERKTREEAKEKEKATEKTATAKEFPRPESRPTRPQRPSSPVMNEAMREKEKEKEREIQRIREISNQRRLFQEKIDECYRLLQYLDLLHKPVAQTEELVTSEKVTSTIESKKLEETGLKKLKKATDDERDAWLLGGKGKSKKQKRAKKAVRVENPEDKILMHSLDKCQAFQDIGVALPDTLADVPKAIETLQSLKAQYERKRDNPEAARPTTPPKTEKANTTADGQVVSAQNPSETEITDNEMKEAVDDEPISAAQVEEPVPEALQPENDTPSDVVETVAELTETKEDISVEEHEPKTPSATQAIETEDGMDFSSETVSTVDRPPQKEDESVSVALCDTETFTESLPTDAPVTINSLKDNAQTVNDLTATETVTNTGSFTSKNVVEPEVHLSAEEVKNQLPTTLEDVDPLEGITKEVVLVAETVAPTNPPFTTQDVISSKSLTEIVRCHLSSENGGSVRLALEVVSE